MSPKMSEKELLSRLAELPREISPGRDPWPGIISAIENMPAGSGATKSRASWWFMAAAASVMLAISAGLVMKPLYEENAVSTDSLASGDPVTSVVDQVNVYQNSPAPGMFNIVDAEYVAAFREFINAGDSHAGLAPQTVEKIEMGWADLRVTEKALAAALEQHPNDLFLNERMLELRARQLGFLKQLVSLDRNNRRLTI